MSLPTDLRTVFLDVGGPIYSDGNFLTAVIRAVQDARQARGLPAADNADVQAIYDEIRDRQGGSLRTALAERLLGDGALRIELDDRTREYWHHPADTLYPDVEPLLRALHGRVVVGIVANQERVVIDALRRDGLDRYVDVWGVSAVVGHQKPSPALFRWALAEAGTTAEHAVHVGNRLDTDVRPAKALGIGTVWVMRGEAPDHPTDAQRAEADLAVDDLTGLADVLLPLVGGRV